MTTWADAHARAAAMAAEVIADLDIPLDRPVDVFSVIERLDIVLAFAPLGHVSGWYVPATKGHPPGILLNDAHPRTRQRYTAGHELGHHYFGQAAETESDPEAALMRDGFESSPEVEREAEAFGAWLLMPRQLLRHALESLGLSRISTPFDLYTLSLWLGTSYVATARQLAATRLIDQGRADQWAKIQPRTLKLELAGLYVPAEMRNDVWLVDQRRGQQPIEVRPGDRVVLTLEENPSTGYAWRRLDEGGALRVLADSYRDDWEPKFLTQRYQDYAELDGVARPRCLIVEVDPDAGAGVHSLRWAKSRPWTTASPIDEFSLTVNVHPALHGVQLRERELAIA